MHHVKYLILGAGPSGLALAHALFARGERSFVILEQEAKAGGLCRSEQVDGAALDIGGGHFLDVRRTAVLELLFRFLPREEWAEHNRIARIRLGRREVDHPIEANLWQLPIDDQVAYLESIAQSGTARQQPPPESFERWIHWKFGERLSAEYMLPYNRKIWSMPLDELGTYWLEKLPSVSFRETLESCLARKSRGQLPAHGRFLYPRDLKHGYGEVWRRMADSLGERLLLSTPFSQIDLDTKCVNRAFVYDTLITTVPWPVWLQATELPEAVSRAIGALRHIAIDVDYNSATTGSPAHWTYDPDESKSHHRILARENFLAGARGFWTETNSNRRLAGPSSFRHHNRYAYPVNTVHKREHLQVLRQWAPGHQIVPLGRWGLWEHMNSDVAVEQAMQAADALSNGA